MTKVLLSLIAALGVLFTCLTGAGTSTGNPMGSSTGTSFVSHSSNSAHTARENNLWVWPLPGTREVTRYFEKPPAPWAAGHRGVDFQATREAKVFAPATGIVLFRDKVVDRPVLTILVEDARYTDGTSLPETVISLEPLESELEPGDSVSANDLLGWVSSGGHCLAGCLHLGVRVAGEYVNPLRFFFDRPRLIPLAEG